MNEQEVKALLLETGAILEGHFLLTSGLHSPMYVEKFQVLQYPRHTAALCAALAERFANDDVQVVIGPVTGGILLAHEVGKSLNTRAIFSERENGIDRMGIEVHILQENKRCESRNESCNCGR